MNKFRLPNFSDVILASNDDFGGKDNPFLECPEGYKVVGVQVREEIYHGLIDFRVRCGRFLNDFVWIL